MKKRGISLIVLIVTIIVVIILAAVVILTLSKNNPIESAKEATFKEDIRAYQDELNMYIAKEYQQSAGMRDWKITATEYEKDSTKENYNNSVYKYLNSFKKKYENKLAIEDDEIVYIGRDKKERSWTNNIVKMNAILTIKYIYENGEEAAPTHEEVITDGMFEVDSPIIDGYEPDYYTLSDKIEKDMEFIVTYYPWSEGLAYEELDNGFYTVSGIGTFTGKTLVIPRMYNGKRVVKINSSSITGNKRLEKLIIPNSIDIIEAYAFSYCSNIKHLNLDAESIRGWAPFSISELKSLEIGKNVNSISDGAFVYCSKLSNVKINSEKIELTNEPFNSCTSLKEVKVNVNNAKYKVVDGILYSKDGKKIFLYPLGKEGEEYIIPNTVEEIGSSSFKWNSYLKRISIPSNVKKVKAYAFSACKNVDYLYLNAEVTEGWAPYSISGLKKVEIGDNVKTISDSAFVYCNQLVDVTIYSEKIDLNNEPFNSCLSLKEVKVNSENKKYKVIDGVLYSKDGKKIYMYPLGKEGEEYNIPSTVEEIGPSSFKWNSNLKRIRILDSVKIVQAGAFDYCKNIEYIFLNSQFVNGWYTFRCPNVKKIDIGTNVKKIDRNIFTGCNKTEEFNFLGSKSQWENIDISNYWKDGSNITTIHCTDGDISI